MAFTVTAGYENLPNEMYVRILTRDLVGTIHFLNGVI